MPFSRQVEMTSQNQSESAMAVDSNSKPLSWMEFYKAVRTGQHSLVRSALPTHDFRIWLEHKNSALDIACYYGHIETILTIIESEGMEKLKDSAKAKHLMDALVHGCETGRLTVVDLLLYELRKYVFEKKRNRVKLDKDAFRKLYMTAICGKCNTDGRYMDIIHLLEKFSPVPYQEEYLKKAFEHGKRDILIHLMEKGNIDREALARIMEVPDLYVKVALRDLDGVREEIEQEKEEKWYAILDPMVDGNGRNLSAFYIAADFGDLEILTMLLIKLLRTVSRPSEEVDFRCLFMLIMRHAVQKDRADIVKCICTHIGLEDIWWAAEFMDCGPYSGVALLKIVFDALANEDISEYIDELRMLCCMVMTRGIDRYKHDCSKIIDTCIEKTGRLLGKDSCDQRAVMDDNTYCTQAFIDIADFTCMRSESKVHYCLNYCFKATYSRSRKMPSPAIVEYLLGKLPKGSSSCQCGEVQIMDKFLTYFNKSHEYYENWLKSPYHDNFTDFYDCLDHTNVYIELFANHGVVPKRKTVSEHFENVLSDDQPSRYNVAKMLCMIDWLDLTWVLPQFEIKRYKSAWSIGEGWLLKDCENRDLIFTHLLKAMASSGNRKWHWDGFLVYILSPIERRQHYVECIKKLDLVIRDDYFDQCQLHIKASTAFKEVDQLRRPEKWLPLQTRCRLQLHRNLRQFCDQNILNGGAFMPLSKLLNQYCAKQLESVNFPSAVIEHAKFDDLFRDWNLENFPPGANVFKDLIDQLIRTEMQQLLANHPPNP